jgi:CheY-like chemotaxis protein
MTTLPSQGRPAEILLVDDSSVDFKLTCKAFERERLLVNLHHVENGEECLAFLRKQGKYSGVPTPDLILLDINMPVMDGHEVLAELVQDENLKHLPVIVLTSSEDERDVLMMYKLRCNAYLTKPVDALRFQEVVKLVNAFWLKIVVLPTKQ